MKPFFSIITPTIIRPTLTACCRSVDDQKFEDWEHIVMVDRDYGPEGIVGLVWNEDKREAIKCPVEHRNFGNTCRHLAWQHCTGDYILYLDDDNTLADEGVLERIANAITAVNYPEVCIFPMLRHGQRFYSYPPRCCHIDTANLVVRREIGQWPNRDEYTIDGIFIEELFAKYGCQGFPNMEPIVVMEKSSEGK